MSWISAVKNLITPNIENERRQTFMSKTELEKSLKDGVHFRAKYIGCVSVNKPESKVDIISCMRKIRHEFAANYVHKRKVMLKLTEDQIEISIKRAARRRRGDTSVMDLLIHKCSLQKIHFVTHDIIDELIFSFIYNIGERQYMCCVLKAYRKMEASAIIHVFGQSFSIVKARSESNKTFENLNIVTKNENKLLPVKQTQFSEPEQKYYLALAKQYEQELNSLKDQIDMCMKIVDAEKSFRESATIKLKEAMELNRDLTVMLGAFVMNENIKETKDIYDPQELLFKSSLINNENN